MEWMHTPEREKSAERDRFAQQSNKLVKCTIIFLSRLANRVPFDCEGGICTLTSLRSDDSMRSISSACEINRCQNNSNIYNFIHSIIHVSGACFFVLRAKRLT